MVKSTPAVQEIQLSSWMGKEMAIHFSILAGKSHGQRSLAGYHPWGPEKSDATEPRTV